MRYCVNLQWSRVHVRYSLNVHPLKIFVYKHKYLSCCKGRLKDLNHNTKLLLCWHTTWILGTQRFFPSLVLKEHSRSAFLYAPNCVSNPYQMDLNCKQKSSITADWRTCRMVFRWCNWKNAPGIGDYRMAETERGRSGERDPDSLRLLVLKFQTAVYERMCVI